jgi:hypothetical protein
MSDRYPIADSVGPNEATTPETIRATFDLTLSGDPAEVAQAAEELIELLSAEGFIFDEDFTGLFGEGFALTGVRLHTAGAISTALRLVPAVNAYLIETNEELL